MSTPKNKYLTKLKNSGCLELALASLDSWLSNPFNRELVWVADDIPTNIFSSHRSEDLVKLNAELDKPYKDPLTNKTLFNVDFITLGSDGVVIGYFQAVIRELSGGVVNASGLRTWRLCGSPYRFGKAQQEFYRWLEDNVDTVTGVFGANTSFAAGEVTIDGKATKKESLKAIFDANRSEDGFSQPGGFRRLITKDTAVYFPYSGSGIDLNGDKRLSHTIQWVTERGVRKGLTKESLPKMRRGPGTTQLLYELNIKVG